MVPKNVVLRFQARNFPGSHCLLLLSYLRRSLTAIMSRLIITVYVFTYPSCTTISVQLGVVRESAHLLARNLLEPVRTRFVRIAANAKRTTSFSLITWTWSFNAIPCRQMWCSLPQRSGFRVTTFTNTLFLHQFHFIPLIQHSFFFSFNCN